MASVLLSKDFLSSSSPIPQSATTRSCKRYLNSPAKEIDALSPIKANPAQTNLFQSFNALDKNCNATIILSQLKRNKILNGVSRKLRFTELSNLVDITNGNCPDNDSGLGSEIDISNSEDFSISNSLTYVSTDENSNIISKLDNSPLKSDILFSVAKDSKSKDKTSEVLDNRIENNSVNTKAQNVIFNLDILGELGLRNCTAVLKLIFSYLSNEDLRKICYVCKDWQDMVIDDKAANIRREEYINQRKEIANGPEKENRFYSKCRFERTHKSVLLSVINKETSVPHQPLTFTQTVGRFDSFIQEAENLFKEEKLTKCPKCLYPSKAQSGCKFVCTRKLCKHDFCKKCMGPYLDNHSCSVQKLNNALPKLIVGSKQSRRNLRRL